MDIVPIGSQRDYRRVLAEIEGLMSARPILPKAIGWMRWYRLWRRGKNRVVILLLSNRDAVGSSPAMTTHNDHATSRIRFTSGGVPSSTSAAIASSVGITLCPSLPRRPPAWNRPGLPLLP
jgi:hypothetical protein